MISFNYETDFEIANKADFTNWISRVIASENKTEGEINYIFCNDDYLHQINLEYLNHDTLTDIISFDYSVGNEIHGDIYISVERVADNAQDFEVSFDEELRRVIIHGVLHYCGYKDKSPEQEILMRQKEDEKIKMFHVEQ
ncbi:rRNA maturation RNase YbeY [Flavobacterium sp. NST-5]|uniref:Endoribonuclease YbeY n=1 Tax=Flavobacterium ichthyis TaxID=2698827 RepID=A0ABW9ZA29_9FLAO|nr:rRNA maturation RNase YbeY [Flavobacterium ichthyis]NBL65753.1 rRNA maturation RNase YbeY [Flavobacterium ichthyis]